MNRRSLFRSLGLAAVVAGVSALPKAPKIERPEMLVPDVPEPVMPIIQTPWFPAGVPAGSAIWQVPAPFPYSLVHNGGAWTTGTNQITFTNSANLVITGGAGPQHTSGYVQVVPQT